MTEEFIKHLEKIAKALLIESLSSGEGFGIPNWVATNSYGRNPFLKAIASMSQKGEDILPLFPLLFDLSSAETNYNTENIIVQYVSNPVNPRPEKTVEMANMVIQHKATLPGVPVIIHNLLFKEHPEYCVDCLLVLMNGI